jgi:plastocyanin
MHALAAQLPVIFAAEKSRTAFYIIGSVLVAWALIVSLALGLRRREFPPTQTVARAVMVISAALVIATGAAGVITAGTPAKTAAAAPPSKPGAPAIATTAHLEASKTTLAFDTKQLTAKAGRVTIIFTNESQVEHNVTVARPGLRGTKAGEVLGATPTFKGGSRQLTLTLAAGTYTYFCSVPGHREAGMEGKLTVNQ